MAKAVSPPSSIEAEKILIGCILLDPNKFVEAAGYIIEDEVFYDNRNQLLWRKIKNMISNGDEVDQTTVCAQLSQREINEGLGAFYITGLTTDSLDSTNVESYAQIIYSKYLMRRLINETHNIKENAYQANGNAFDLLNNTHNIIGELIELQPHKEFDINNALHEALESIHNSERNLIQLGYPELDRMCGGLTRGELTIIGGRPGHGKSTFSLNLLKNMIDAGYKCVLFNREMSNTEMLKKLVVLESGLLSYSMVRNGSCGDEASSNELQSTVDIMQTKYSKDKFLMFDNIKDFNKAASEVKKFKPDVIFDDYIQLIVPDNKINERRLQLEKIIHEYKWLAKNVNCAVVLVSQLNRGIESRGNPVPRLSDLAESGSIEQAAENVFFSYYDYKIFGNDSLGRGHGKEVIEIIAGKVRYGETGAIKMDFKGDKVKISERYI